MSAKRGLGRGLNALISEMPTLQSSAEAGAISGAKITDENTGSGAIEIDINKIEPNRSQPRKAFDDTALQELSESISAYGIIQPLIVKPVGSYYEIIAGERRWRAARKAGLQKVPIIIKLDADDLSSVVLGLIENIQREDLSPLEEAETYKRLIDEFGFTQEQLSTQVGKSRTSITNAIRLLNLDSRAKNFLTERKISAGHARALLSIPDKNIQFEISERIIEDELNVRQTERLVADIIARSEAGQALPEECEQTKPGVDEAQAAAYRNVENQLKQILGTRVRLSKNKNKGKIEIEYYTSEDLDRLLLLLKKIEVDNRK